MKTILLVEDDPFLIDIYTSQFRKAGYNIQVAPNGESALLRIKEAKPDLMLLDIVLPKIDGWEVLKKLRQEMKINDLKVIVFSNNIQKDDSERWAKLNVLKCIPKTKLTPSELLEEIEKILK
jgi:two-component system alkaline phosphatase synthesis response regulator PhoP